MPVSNPFVPHKTWFLICFPFLQLLNQPDLVISSFETEELLIYSIPEAVEPTKMWVCRLLNTSKFLRTKLGFCQMKEPKSGCAAAHPAHPLPPPLYLIKFCNFLFRFITNAKLQEKTRVLAKAGAKKWVCSCTPCTPGLSTLHLLSQLHVNMYLLSCFLLEDVMLQHN